ncbi:hypothetical protein GQX74_008035 [Glossina fuscipes]|nr:hypothetical protein GQX74_008035 [Glossina fuscipes]
MSVSDIIANALHIKLSPRHAYDFHVERCVYLMKFLIYCVIVITKFLNFVSKLHALREEDQVLLRAAEAAAHTLTHHHHHHHHHYYHHHHHHHHHHQYHYHRHSRQYCGGIFARLHIHNRAMTAAAVGVSLYEYGLSGCNPGKLCLNKQSAYVIVFNTFPGHSFVTLICSGCSQCSIFQSTIEEHQQD